MRDSGITAFTQKSWISTKLYTGKGLEYLEATSPEYYKAVADFSTPYVKLGGDFYIVVRNLSIKVFDNVSNYVTTTKPVVMATVRINKYMSIRTYQSACYEYLQYNILLDKINKIML